MFGIGGNEVLYRQHWDDPSDITSGTGWQPFGGRCYNPPVVVSYQGAIHVFVINEYGDLNVVVFGGAFEPEWKEVAGGVISTVAIASWGEAGYHVFARIDGGMYMHGFYNENGWVHWEAIGENFASEPAAVAWGPARLDVFGLGTSGDFLWRRWDGERWSPWQSLGGIFNSPPTVVSKRVGHLTLFGIDEDGNMLHKYYSHGVWSAEWENLQGNLTTTVSVLVSSVSDTKRYDVFGIDTDGMLSHKAWTGTAWTRWTKHFGPFGSAPVVVGWGSNRFDVFGLNSVLNAVHQAWNGEGWLPSISSGNNLRGSFISFE